MELPTLAILVTLAHCAAFAASVLATNLLQFPQQFRRDPLKRYLVRLGEWVCDGVGEFCVGEFWCCEARGRVVFLFMPLRYWQLC
jgi:hypothetical protein